MNKKVIINGDDLGISPGVNQAICEAGAHGCLTHASLMVNGGFFEDAVSNLNTRCPGLITGVHLNLTYGKGLLRSHRLTGEDGTFKHGFLGLLVRTMLDKRLLEDIEKELEAQLSCMKESGLPVEHMDSHRHIHMIPGIYRIVKRLSERHGVSRIRVPNERFLQSLRIARSVRFLLNGGIVKFLVLRILSLWNGVGARKNFFSVLYTGETNAWMLGRILSGDEEVEVAVHPGTPEIDRDTTFLDSGTKQYWCSEQRRKELEACLAVRMTSPSPEGP